MIYAECILQGESQDIARQRKAVEHAAKQQGWRLCKIYVEAPSAARTPMVDRKTIQDLLADAVLKRFDVLMFTDFAHLGSDDDKVAAFLLQMDQNGISLFDVSQNKLSLATKMCLADFLEVQSE